MLMPVKKKKKPDLPPEIKRFFQETGEQGGKARAAKHSQKELSDWGKMGGRPKGSGKKRMKKGTK
jgi:hypothetical protein